MSRKSYIHKAVALNVFSKQLNQDIYLLQIEIDSNQIYMII